MKNTTWFLALTMGIMMISCNTEPAKTEVVVVPAAPIPAQPKTIEKTRTIIVEKEPKESSTTIVLDKNGVKLEATKINVTVKPK